MATSKSHVVGVTTVPSGHLYRVPQWVLQLKKPEAGTAPRPPRLPADFTTDASFLSASSLQRLQLEYLPPPRSPPPSSPWGAGPTLVVNPDVCKTHPGSLQRTPLRCAHSGPAPPAAHLHAAGLSSVTGHRALCVPVMRPCSHSGVADSPDPLPADGLWTQNQPSPLTLACTVGLPCSEPIYPRVCSPLTLLPSMPVGMPSSHGSACRQQGSPQLRSLCPRPEPPRQPSSLCVCSPPRHYTGARSQACGSACVRRHAGHPGWPACSLT